MEGWPQHFELFPKLERAGRFLVRLVSQLPEQPLASHGDHFIGGGPALDAALYDEVQTDDGTGSVTSAL